MSEVRSGTRNGRRAKWALRAWVLSAVCALPGAAHAEESEKDGGEEATPRENIKGAVEATRETLEEAHRPNLDLRVGVLNEPRNRSVTGTSWLPSRSPTYALIFPVRDWGLAVRGNIFAGFGYVSGDRGAIGSVTTSTLLLAALGKIGPSELTVRGVMSFESLLNDEGNPAPLRSQRPADSDRQAPHAFTQELAVAWIMPLADLVAIELYGGLMGAPAFGPPDHAFRPSAYFDPIAPLTAPVLEPTNSVPGVVTAGLTGREYKLEGSWFRAAEQDPPWHGFTPGPFDSWSLRAFAVLHPGWSASVSYGLVREPASDDRSHRALANLLYSHEWSARTQLDATAVVGVAVPEGGGAARPAVLLEATGVLRERHVVFARAELRQGPQTLRRAPPQSPLTPTGAVGGLSAGYVYSFHPFEALAPGLGVRAEMTPVSDSLRDLYGAPVVGMVSVFAQLRQISLPGPPGKRAKRGD